jgi:hypothetical protein
MKREVDRFIGGPPDREQDAAVEVYLIVADTGGREVRAGWYYAALAVAVAVTAAALFVVGTGSGRRSGSTSAASTAVHPGTRSAPATGAACVRGRGYGGLGARMRDFDANNNNSTGPAGPTPGPAFYTVTGTARGCVTAFAVQDFTGPPATARGLLFLVSHPYLPGDAKQLVGTDTCAVWKSAALERATGSAYARATASAQSGSTPGRARIETTSSPRC